MIFEIRDIILIFVKNSIKLNINHINYSLLFEELFKNFIKFFNLFDRESTFYSLKFTKVFLCGINLISYFPFINY